MWRKKCPEQILRTRILYTVFACFLLMFCSPVRADDPEIAKQLTQRREQYEYPRIYSLESGSESGNINENFLWQEDPLYEAPATHYQVWIHDTPDYLTEEEEAELLEIMKPVAEYGNVTIDLNDDSRDAVTYYHEFYKNEGYADESGILLVVCTGSKTVSMFCQGKVQEHIDGQAAFDIGTKQCYSLGEKKERENTHFAFAEITYFTFAKERMEDLSAFLKATSRSMNPESGYTAWVIDGAHLLSEIKRQELLEAARNLSKETNIVIVIAQTDTYRNKVLFDNPYLKQDNYVEIKLNPDPSAKDFLELKTGAGFEGVLSENALKNLAEEVAPLYKEEAIIPWVEKVYEAILTKEADSVRTVSADSGYTIQITDSEGLLSREEKEKLLKIMEPVAVHGNVAFESYSSSLSGKQYCTENYMEKGFFDKSGTVFLINMSERYIWLYTGGKMEKTINARRATSITDNVYKFASKGRYFDCAAEVFRQEGILLKGGFILQPMRLLCCLLIAFGLSLLGVYIFICRERGIKSGLPDRKTSMSGDVALAGAAAVTVTKRVVHSNSGGSGSSGGGGGFSGGGFSGGGGGFSGGGHKF